MERPVMLAPGTPPDGIERRSHRQRERRWRWRRSFASLSFQTLAAFALVTILPLVAAVVQARLDLSKAETRASEDAGVVAQVASGEIESVFEAVFGVGRMLESQPEFWTGDDETRDAILNTAGASQQVFNALLYYTLDLQQHGQSNHVPRTPRPDVSHRAYAREAANTGQLAVTSEMLISVANGERVLPVALPLRPVHGMPPVGLLVVGLKLDRIPGVWSKIPLPDGASITLLDTREGRVLVGSGEWAGRINETVPAEQAELVRQTRSASRLMSGSRLERLWAWNQVDLLPWVVVVDIPAATVFAPIYGDITRRAVTASGAALAALVVLLVVRRTLTRRLDLLQRATTRWAAGDWSYRTRSQGSDELSQLGRDFDGMADQVEAGLSDLRRQYEEAELARGETRAVLDATNEAMCLFTPDGRLQLINLRFTDLFGLIPEAIVGHGVEDLWPELDRVLTDGAAFRTLFRLGLDDPNLVMREDLAQDWPVPRELAVFSTPVTGADGRIAGRLWTFRDVTRERAVDRMKTDFVSLVSHELRTPLTSIKGYVDLMLDGDVGDLTADQREFLTIVKNNADREAALINSLLDISRMETGSFELVRQPLSILGVIQRAQASLQPQLAQKQHHLAVHLPPDLPLVDADSERVTQIITNLLSNAIKYTPAGGQIVVSGVREGDLVRVDVRDSGIGLTDADQRQLFTKFFRATNRTTQEVGGTGLGLAITRSLVELHGGNIWVESAPGQGSTFHFTLPCAATHQTPAESPSPAAARRPGGRVLVIEDEPDIAALIGRYLENGGYQACLATTGADGLRLARAEPPDLITLDVLLPDADGFTVLEWLKADPLTSSVPVVMVTIVPDDGRSRTLGATDCMTKPVSAQVLLGRIGQAMVTVARRRILVADRDERARVLIVGHLRQSGYEVIEASDGQEAIFLAQQYQPDLMLLGVEMAVLDGASVLKQVRQEADTRALPVVMMATTQDAVKKASEIVESMGGAGAVFMVTPCTPAGVASAVAQALGHSRNTVSADHGAAQPDGGTLGSGGASGGVKWGEV